VIVEAEELDGLCLNRGCIPTKALLKTTDVGRTIKEAGHFGWFAGIAEPKRQDIVKYSRDVSGKLSGGVEFLMKKNGIKVLKGWGKLLGS
jgi:dihydrolipoamide dehydrogenase